MKVRAKAARERFQSGAHDYAAYLETPEGRLRSDLTFANLQDFLPLLQAKGSLCALDLGCGTGATAVRLARLGIHVTLIDSSPAMLDMAKLAAREAGVTDEARIETRRCRPIGELIPDGIVRLSSLPQHTGICRRSGCCVARCGWCVAGLIGDTVNPCAEPGWRSLQGRYPSRRFGGCGK